ncbi:MAG: lytic murein transglycosylase, partial [Pseudomonadota bacterium]|nr:lytic murein transglycosylase [Pseudomonadota bacterium]
MRLLSAFVFGFVLLSAPSAWSASCGNGPGGFEAWKQSFIANSQSYGLKKRVVEPSLKNVKYNKKVVSLDRNQKSFKLSFNQFYAKRV